MRSISSKTLSESGTDVNPSIRKRLHRCQIGHDWLDAVGPPSSDGEESVTEPETGNDSDNEDVADDGVDMPEYDFDEDEPSKQSEAIENFLNIQSAKYEAETADSYTLTSQIKMGEDDAATEYDTEAFFKHL
jgi:hypothetical protein